MIRRFRKRRFGFRAPLIAMLLAALAPRIAAAQEEIVPPAGAGRVVVVVSGQTGPAHYREVASRIAALGYDVVLFDGNPMEGTHGQGLRAAIAQAQRMPHALPGKVALVGFSLGGAIVLGFGSGWSDQVAVVAAWYPATSPFTNVPGWARHLAAPVVMFAGESDTYLNCCLIGKAHDLADAAQAANASFELTTYPATGHDFVIGGAHYNPQSYADAFARTEAALRRYLSAKPAP
ncbi:MAG TPA: dienelactone hydrolase family protein [Stellaceae bacterium]|nr:dienelactone hydrolase family protein [Stellaceae bacterium]